ncbi:hypothetical protein MGI18_24775 [Bacillus sp. OVS6]|nr:hypothetical protein MGI18_24775 [Bacillus sp. OVS6]
MKNYVLPSMLIGSVLLLSACKPIDWAEKQWNSPFNNVSSEKKKKIQKIQKKRGLKKKISLG